MKTLQLNNYLRHALLAGWVMISLNGFAQNGGADFESGPLMNQARIQPVMAALDDGRAIAFGGRGFGFISLQYADIYDPATHLFTQYTMNGPRDFSSVVKMEDGKYFVIGGGMDLGVPAYSSCEIFDPADNSFTPAGSMNYARMEPSATRLSDGNIFIAGGWYDDYAASAVEVYFPDGNSFSLMGNLAVPRAHAIVLPTDDGGAIICGGWGPYGTPMITTVEYFNAEMESMEPFADEMIPEDPGWVTWNQMRPNSDYLLSNGKYILLGYRNITTPEYGLISFDPSTKEFSLLTTIDLTVANGGIFDMAIDREHGLVYLLGVVSPSDPVQLSLITADIYNEIVYYPDFLYTAAAGDYFFPTLTFLPSTGKILLTGISASPSDYFNATNKTLLLTPDINVGVEQELLVAGQVICYPNPAVNDFSLSFTDLPAGSYKIQIIDMQGSILYTAFKTAGAGGIAQWNFKEMNLPGGLYTIKIYGRSWEGTSRLVIAK